MSLGGGRNSAEQQHEIREARRFLKETVKNDWYYPSLPRFQRGEPVREEVREQPAEDEQKVVQVQHVESAEESVEDYVTELEQRIGGFKFHGLESHDRDLAESLEDEHLQDVDVSLPDLGFEAVEWRERQYSTDEEMEDEDSDAESTGSGGSTYKFDGPESVGVQLLDRETKRRRKRLKRVQDESVWNDGLAHWLKRRDLWCKAHTAAQIQLLESRRADSVNSTSVSANSTPRTSTSASTTDEEEISEPGTSPATTPEFSSESSIVSPQRPPSEMLVPVAPPILPNHPIRRRITPETYPEIYSKIILQARSPSVPINLMTMVRALVQGWKDDGEWPPKQGPLEKSIARKKNGGESSLRSSVKAVGRILKITGASTSGVADKLSSEKDKS